MLETIPANWPAPPNVRALTTTRGGGISPPPYASLNLATHVGDDIENVRLNRAHLAEALQLPNAPIWLDQHHGTRIIDAATDGDRRADGAFTRKAGVVCAILTADCLPVLLCDRDGSQVCALHAGWRGLAAGIIHLGIERMAAPAHDLIAWLGPAISGPAYEVGTEVRSAFVGVDPGLAAAFQPTRPNHFHCDLFAIARQQLAAAGVDSIHGGGHCSFSEADRFFSYRRDGGACRDTGRIATLLWLTR